MQQVASSRTLRVGDPFKGVGDTAAARDHKGEGAWVPVQRGVPREPSGVLDLIPYATEQARGDEI